MKRLSLLMCAFAAGVLPAGAAGIHAPDDRVALLLRLSRAALGGAALDRRTIVRLDGSVSQGGLSGTASQWLEIGGTRFAESYRTDPLAGSDGFDGDAAWNRDRSGVVWIDGSVAGRAQAISSAFLADDRLWSRGRGGATVGWAGPQAAGGRNYDSLEVSVPGSAVPLTVWFDRQTHLPARFVQVIGADTTTVTLGDYHRVGAVMIPFVVRARSSDGNASDTTVARSDVDPPDGADKLVKPESDVHDFAIADGAKKTTIPFDLVDNHVYLDVMLDGKGPYRFIFDTGGQNVVDAQVAREIGAVGKGSVQAGGVGAATEAVSFANVDELKLGTATLKDQLFSVAPVRAGFGVSGGRAVDGLIGFEVLARFITTFDYGRSVVELALPGTAAPTKDADVLPFVFHGEQPQFACTLDGIATQCTLDTGERAAISLFAPFIAAHPSVVPKTATAPGVNGFGFGGPAMGRLGRLASVHVGSFELADIIADFTTQTHGAFAAPFVGANVGGALLRRFTLYLDYPENTMALTPGPAYGDRDSYERSGIFLLDRAGRKIVYDVRPGTPAQAAGIVAGDAIVTIDGKDASGESLDDVRRAFFAPAGTVVRLGLVAKDGAPRTATLILRDYV
jgi:hypothetical protein